MKKTAFGGNRNECLLPKKKLNKHDRSAAIFCGCILGILVAHWLIFYLYANLNSILLAFQRYNPGSHEYEFLKGANVFDNFVWIFTEMFKGRNIGSYVLNGFLYQFTGVVIAFPVGIMFAFLIYKKAPFTGVYKVILFLPSMVSAMVIALMFKYFLENGVPDIFGVNTDGIMTDRQPINLILLLAYSTFMAMPGSLLVNIGTMSRVPPELVEYGKLEGMSLWQEFIHLTLPLMYPLLQASCLGIFSGIFGAQGALYAIYAEGAPENTVSFGYFVFTSVVTDMQTNSMYGYTAAINLLIGAISLPIVWGTKKLFDHFDPEAEF